jgi:hypothetical protein
VSKLPDAPPQQGAPPPSLVRRYGTAFGRFWWEFLVGDTPELLVGAILIVSVGAVFAHNGVARVITIGSMPVLIVALLATSVQRARRAARSSRPPET